jgi:hypothetical protein
VKRASISQTAVLCQQGLLPSFVTSDARRLAFVAGDRQHGNDSSLIPLGEGEVMTIATRTVCLVVALVGAVRAQDTSIAPKPAVDPSPQGIVFAATFSPDGKQIALARFDKTVIIHDWPSGKARTVLSRSAGPARGDGEEELRGTSAAGDSILTTARPTYYRARDAADASGG